MSMQVPITCHMGAIGYLFTLLYPPWYIPWIKDNCKQIEKRTGMGRVGMVFERVVCMFQFSQQQKTKLLRLFAFALNCMVV